MAFRKQIDLTAGSEQAHGCAGRRTAAERRRQTVGNAVDVRRSAGDARSESDRRTAHARSRETRDRRREPDQGGAAADADPVAQHADRLAGRVPARPTRGRVGRRSEPDASYVARSHSSLAVLLWLAACGGGRRRASATEHWRRCATATEQPDGGATPSAAKLLDVTTFGADYALIDAVAREGNAAWLDRQFTLPPSNHLPIVLRYLNQYGFDINANPPPGTFRRFAWWEQTLTAPDQLRQRVAYALTQIFVVSDNVDAIFINPLALSSYYDMLLANAFGNFRDLLRAVTLHPVMGVYLSHVNNAKANPATNTFPDENYAREVMQLFTHRLVRAEQRRQPEARCERQSDPDVRQRRHSGICEDLHGFELRPGASRRRELFRQSESGAARADADVRGVSRSRSETSAERRRGAGRADRHAGHRRGDRQSVQSSRTSARSSAGS